MEPYVRLLLSPDRLRRHRLFNPEYVKSLLEDFYRGRTDLGTKLWVLMVFQIWYEAYMEDFFAG